MMNKSERFLKEMKIKIRKEGGITLKNENFIPN